MNRTEYLNALSGKVIGMCIEIHRELNPGLLESIYEECLAHELQCAGLSFERQRPVPIKYKQLSFDCGQKCDIVVDNLLILELKVVAQLLPIHDAQLLTYLKLLKLLLGLLVNFQVPVMKDGIKRLANERL